MIKWQDTSSFSQRDTDRTPRSWTLEVGRFRLVVFRHRGIDPDLWFATCHGLFDTRELQRRDVGEAKEEALEMLCRCLHGALNDAARVERTQRQTVKPQRST